MSFWMFLKTSIGTSVATTLGGWLLSIAGVLGLGSLVGLGQVVLFKASVLPPPVWAGLFVVAVVLTALAFLHAGWKLLTATEQRAEAAEFEIHETVTSPPAAQIVINGQNFGGATVIEEFGNLEMNDGHIQGPVTIRGGVGSVSRNMRFGGPSSSRTESGPPPAE